MSTLNQESKVENIALSGTVDGATVRMSFSREDGKPIRQITAQAVKTLKDGGQMNVYIDYQLANAGVNINVHNCGLEGVPLGLIEGLLTEMVTVNNQ